MTDWKPYPSVTHGAVRNWSEFDQIISLGVCLSINLLVFQFNGERCFSSSTVC